MKDTLTVSSLDSPISDVRMREDIRWNSIPLFVRVLKYWALFIIIAVGCLAFLFMGSYYIGGGN